ncbi:MAG TPA: tetratricopeptide repeat protein, partial [Verrucomicrobiae bacterium]|nr:tetratricopeptide repeat protein [Verrucomicrobiae bacterium]
PDAKRAPCEVALGMLALRAGDAKAAEASLKRAQSLDPKLSAVYSGLGGYYLVQKDLKQADQALKTAAELSPPRSPRRLQYARFKAQTGDVAAAKAMLQEMTQKTPDFLAAWMALAEIAAAEKNAAETKYAESTALLAKVLARDPDHYDALLMDAGLKLAKGETLKAVAGFERLTKLYPKAAHAQYNLALAYLANNEIAKAVASLNQALAVDPQYADAIVRLADLRIRQGDVNPAAASLRQLVQQQPQRTDAQLLLADLYRAQGNFDDALAVYRKLAELFPKNPQVPMLAGMVLLQQNESAAARKSFARALELAPDYLLALGQLVELDLQEKKYPDALQLIAKQLERTPNAAEPRLLEARVNLAQGNTYQAEASLSKAIELQPDYRAAYLLLAQIYVASNQQQKALDDLRQVLAKNSKDTVALLQMAIIQTLQKDYKAARDTYEEMLKINPKHSQALNNLAYMYSEQLGQLDKAYDLGRRARELLPSDPATADTLGWILYRREQYPQALNLLQESAIKLPDEPEIQYHLGMAYYMLGEETPARVALQRALNGNREFPGKNEIGPHLSVLDVDPKTTSVALPDLEKKLAEDPKDPVALTRLAAVYERNGATEKAIRAYEAARKLSQQNVKATIGLARLVDPEKGFALAKEAYKLAPDDPEVSHVLGWLAYRKGDYKWSLSLLQETARQQPGNPELLYQLAEAAYSRGQVSDAETALRGVLAAGKTSPEADQARRFLDLIALNASPSTDQSSVDRVGQILKTDPANAPALMAMAAIDEKKSDLKGAIQCYETVLDRYSDFSPANRRLAILYSVYSEDAANDAKAYKQAVKAREAFPDDPELARTLGILLYRQKDYARSVKMLKESADKMTGDASLMYYLGMTQYQLNQRTESKKTLQRALDLNLPGKLAAEAQRVLKELK